MSEKTRANLFPATTVVVARFRCYPLREKVISEKVVYLVYNVTWLHIPSPPAAPWGTRSPFFSSSRLSAMASNFLSVRNNEFEVCFQHLAQAQPNKVTRPDRAVPWKVFAVHEKQGSDTEMQSSHRLANGDMLAVTFRYVPQCSESP